jgi:predicted phage terminase large subunit-like protein
VIQSWDTASKAGELNDYSVCTTWAIVADRYYLLDVVRERLEFPALKQRVVDEADRWGAQIVLIEDKGSGMSLLQELQSTGFYRGRGMNPVGDKASRLVGVTAMIEAGRVFLPHSAGWLEDFLLELCGFPAVRHDDQVDSTSQALDWFRTEGNAGGLWHYYREEAEKMVAHREHRTVHMRAPTGVSHLITREGEWLAVGNDRTIWLTEEAAASAAGAGFTRLTS